MFILQAKNIKKSFGARTVLDFEGLQVYEGDRIGIVGANGSGKTTLLNILSGEAAPDEGVVDRRCEPAYIRQLQEKSGQLSGGENAKRQTQHALGQEDSIVFADEPTANLDEAGVRWVQQRLLAARTVLLVSHDRDLLNAVCNRIIEIRDGKLVFFKGRYADYEAHLEKEKANRELQYREYQRKKAGLEAAVQVREGKLAHQRQQKKRDYVRNASEARLGGHKRAASMKKQEHIAKVLRGRLDRLESVERVKELPGLHMDFALTQPPGNKRVIACEDLHFAYGEKTVFSGASFTVANGEKLAITGRNGCGKTTLLRLIDEGCDAIRTVPKLKLGYLHQGFEDLATDESVLENVLCTSIQSRETVRGMLAGLLFRGDAVFKKVEVLSGGERMRVALAKLIAADNNALLLDEPTNYLDIRAIEAVERVLQDYPGTLLLVSHDSRFVEAIAGRRLVICDGRLREEAAAPVSAGADSARKTLLELRRIGLLSRISQTPPEEKTVLEAEYAAIVAELREIG